MLDDAGQPGPSRRMSELDLREKPNRIPWPPVIYVASLALAMLLQFLLPFRNLDRLLAEAPRWIGIVLMVSGAAIDFAAMMTLRKHGTTVLPNAGSKALCTSGVYGFSRNPIYLGNAVGMAGLALALRWSWLLLLVPVASAAVTWLAIAREEEHLRYRFGTAYREYCERVRRWV